MFGEHTNPVLAQTPEYSSNLMLVAAQKESTRPVEEIHANDGEVLPEEISLPLDADPQLMKLEIERLTTLVNSYENGRAIRLIKWLQSKGLPI